MFKKILPILIFLVLVLPLIFPLLQQGFFKTDDAGWMIIRLSAFHETLKTGQFPVRFLERLNHGFGYPVLNFNYPLPFYLGEIIHLAGFGFINSVKILFGASFVLGGIFMFLWTKKWGKKAGVVSAVMYSYFLYRIADVYQRGSLGESVAFIFIPLIFLFIDRKNIPLAALSLAALICSHNSLALMFLPVIFFYKPQIKIFLLALGLSTFFWLPAFYDLQYTKTFSTQVSNFRDYFLSNWLVILEVVIPVALGLILLKKKALFWAAATLAPLFFTLPISAIFWETFPLPKIIQFPWRFLAVPTFTVAVLGGLLTEKNKYMGLGLLISFVLIGVLTLKVVPFLEPDSYYSTNDDSTTIKNEYMPKWVKSDPTAKPESMYQIVGDKLQINKVYFPGQTVYVDGKSVPIDFTTNGLLLIDVPKNQNNIEVKYNQTNLHMFANFLSLISLILIGLTLYKRNNVH